MMFCCGLDLAAVVVTTNAGTSTFKVSSGYLIMSPGASVRVSHRLLLKDRSRGSSDLSLPTLPDPRRTRPRRVTQLLLVVDPGFATRHARGSVFARFVTMQGCLGEPHRYLHPFWWSLSPLSG